MYFRFSSLLSVAALAAVVAAAPSSLEARGGSSTSQCNTGSLQCCNSTTSPTDPAIAGLLALLGVIPIDLTGLVGLTCSPITVIGTGTSSCTQDPVCCTGNSFNGVIAIGCTPINLGL